MTNHLNRKQPTKEYYVEDGGVAVAAPTYRELYDHEWTHPTASAHG